MDIAEEECLTVKIISFVIHDPDRFDFIEEREEEKKRTISVHLIISIPSSNIQKKK